MRTSIHFRNPLSFTSLFVFLMFAFSFGNAQELDLDLDEKENNKPETQLPADIPDILWDIKAYIPGSKLIKVKAIDKKGKIYPVKAIQSFDDISMLNVKAIVNGDFLPIKLIVKDSVEKYYPLKAITIDGTLLDIKAISDDGEILPVKGISRSGNIINIRAISNDVLAQSFNVFAISPDGLVNDVKGVKMLQTEEETIINGVRVFAHVKALRQN